MTLVLDASMSLAWLLVRKDLGEAELAREALKEVRGSGAMVPALWYPEVGNALLLAERQRVITAQDSASFLSSLSFWGIAQDPVPPALTLTESILLGRMHNLTAYDATYIALAEAMNAVLYTSDEKLCKGHRARVVLFTRR